MRSLRQAAANIANAILSTGPKTQAGKEVARANAIKHGLAGTVVFPDEERKLAEERAETWKTKFVIENEYDQWLVGRVAMESVRVETCEAALAELHGRQVVAAHDENLWRNARRLDAQVLLDKVRKNPASIVSRVEQTLQGVEWLLELWNIIRLAFANEMLTQEQMDLAFDLLGAPTSCRDAFTKPLGEIIPREIAALEALIPGLTRLDILARASATLGKVPPSEEGRLLRRYLSDAHRRLRQAQAQLTPVSSDPAASAPEPAAPPAPALEPRATPEPVPPPVPAPPPPVVAAPVSTPLAPTAPEITVIPVTNPRVEAGEVVTRACA